MAGAQLPSCVLRTWAKNFNSQRHNEPKWTQWWALPYCASQSSPPFIWYLLPCLSPYILFIFFTQWISSILFRPHSVSTSMLLVFHPKLAFNWPCCLLTLQKICTDKYNISPPPSRWNHDKEWKNLPAVTAPSWPETQKNQVLYLFTERLINILNILTGDLWDETEMLPHLFSISLLMCMYLCNSGFICCAYPCHFLSSCCQLMFHSFNRK